MLVTDDDVDGLYFKTELAHRGSTSTPPQSLALVQDSIFDRWWATTVVLYIYRVNRCLAQFYM